MTAYNCKPWIEDIVFTKGDDIDITFDVYEWDDVNEEWVLFDMTGMQLDIDVCKCDGTVIRSFTSSGGSPEITITGSQYTINDSPFTKKGKYKYDLQITDAGEVYTIQKGNVFVQEEHTT